MYPRISYRYNSKYLSGKLLHYHTYYSCIWWFVNYILILETYLCKTMRYRWVLKWNWNWDSSTSYYLLKQDNMFQRKDTAWFNLNIWFKFMNEVVVWYQISKIDLYVLSGIANEQLKLNAVSELIKLHDNGNDALITFISREKCLLNVVQCLHKLQRVESRRIKISLLIHFNIHVQEVYLFSENLSIVVINCLYFLYNDF